MEDSLNVHVVQTVNLLAVVDYTGKMDGHSNLLPANIVLFQPVAPGRDGSKLALQPGYLKT